LTAFTREIMTRDGRASCVSDSAGRGNTFFRARNVRARDDASAQQDGLVVLSCVGRVGDHFGNQFRSTGRSASLLGPAVCDHPARINPSSVLGVTAQRFTRLYIFILFFALHRRPTNRGAKHPVFVRLGQFKNLLPKAEFISH